MKLPKTYTIHTHLVSDFDKERLVRLVEEIKHNVDGVYISEQHDEEGEKVKKKCVCDTDMCCTDEEGGLDGEWQKWCWLCNAPRS
jgi:hypothetical protein